MSNAPPTINLNELTLRQIGKGERFSAKRGRIGTALGMKKIGCGMVVLQPGKRAWPFHEHYGAEEFFIILEGEGSIRFGDDTFPVRSGDCIFTPPGKGTAHQIVNTSDAELRYLALSSMDDPELCYYPDSGKYGAYSFRDDVEPTRILVHESGATDYWDGEA